MISLAESLHAKQVRFTQTISLFELAVPIVLPGYTLTDGEAYRTPEQAALNAKKGTGISNSLHTKRLARDKNVFKDGVLITDSAKLLPLGVLWEAMGGTWGGRFKDRPDGNHFSFEFQGVK